jgi:hypothetical protein
MVAVEFAIELLDFAIKNIRAENQFFKSIAAILGGMRTYYV